MSWTSKFDLSKFLPIDLAFKLYRLLNQYSLILRLSFSFLSLIKYQYDPLSYPLSYSTIQVVFGKHFWQESLMMVYTLPWYLAHLFQQSLFVLMDQLIAT